MIEIMAKSIAVWTKSFASKNAQLQQLVIKQSQNGFSQTQDCSKDFGQTVNGYNLAGSDLARSQELQHCTLMPVLQDQFFRGVNSKGNIRTIRLTCLLKTELPDSKTIKIYWAREASAVNQELARLVITTSERIKMKNQVHFLGILLL